MLITHTVSTSATPRRWNKRERYSAGQTSKRGTLRRRARFPSSREKRSRSKAAADHEMRLRPFSSQHRTWMAAQFVRRGRWRRAPRRLADVPLPPSVAPNATRFRSTPHELFRKSLPDTVTLASSTNVSSCPTPFFDPRATAYKFRDSMQFVHTIGTFPLARPAPETNKGALSFYTNRVSHLRDSYPIA